MRILHWLNTFLPDVGGIQTFCDQLIPELIDRGHEVLLLTAHTSDRDADHEMMGPIEVRRVDALRAIHSGDPGGMLRSGIEIGRVVQDYSPDLIHMHPCGPEAPYLARLKKRVAVPILATLHNNYGQLDFDVQEGSMFGDLWSSMDRIVSCSDDAGRWLSAERPDLAPRISTIHNGIVGSRLVEAPLAWDPPRLVTACRIEPQKRLDVLIDAFELVARRHPSVELHVLGDGTLLSDLSDRVSAAGLAERVVFAGRVHPDDVTAELRASTIFVLSSAFEGLPIALLEAAREGRPAAVTAAGGVPEVVVDGDTGLVVEPGDVEGLAASIIKMLEDREATEQMGRAMIAHFDAEFSLATCVDAYEGVYRAMLAGDALS